MAAQDQLAAGRWSVVIESNRLFRVLRVGGAVSWSSFEREHNSVVSQSLQEICCCLGQLPRPQPYPQAGCGGDKPNGWGGSHMMPSGPGLRAIIAINLTFLAAAIFAALAWFFWPETAESWRLGLFSVLCGLIAFAMTTKCIGDIWRFASNDFKVAWFQRLGRKPESDHLAGDDAMRKSDMIE